MSTCFVQRTLNIIFCVVGFTGLSANWAQKSPQTLLNVQSGQSHCLYYIQYLVSYDSLCHYGNISDDTSYE